MKTGMTHRLPGLVLTDHTFELPLDYSKPGGEQISVYAREVVAPEHEGESLPWLVFFQGGPGFEAPRPQSSSGWLKRALTEYRVLLLDQRGTGRSTPVLPQTLTRRGNAQQQAAYLTHFRADAIVRDAEQIRCTLVGPNERWSALGQSYGGFCIVHYLSSAPEGLREAFITGGLPPLTRSADEVYRSTYRRVQVQNERYYTRYPGDVARARDVVQFLRTNRVLLPSGDRLSARRFQQLGMAFGDSEGFEHVHYLLERAFVDTVRGRELSYTFLRGVEEAQRFDTNPIYALLHEAIYCQGSASHWAAERVRAEFPAFDLDSDGPLLFTGEMIYPWMFDEYGPLCALKDAAERLAAFEDWPSLYDAARLRANAVPCAAAVYYDDMYVELAFSEEIARAIGGIKLWITNEYAHNGLRADGERVLGRLIDMVRGRA